jgi:NAD(P)-dependent dehydrogenase (short-subunit alcohol dehydrogenase family)
VLPGRLHDKVAVITGGNSGIGLATSRLFRSEGARIAVIGRDPEPVRRTVAPAGEDCLGFAGDVASTQSLNEFYTQVAARFGRIDVLFANAGVSGRLPVEGITEQFFDQLMNVNVKGVLYSIQTALPLLGQRSSIIVNTSINNQIGQAGASVYGASKAAARSMVRTLAVELAPRGIRINAVCPGLIDTEVKGRIGISNESMKAAREKMVQSIPMKRMGTPEELARAVLFFASDDSSYITGAELVVDGGMTQV